MHSARQCLHGHGRARQAATMDVGRLLRAARRQRGLSQRELAALAGVGRSTVASMENDGARPSWPLVMTLLGAMGLDVALALKPTPPAGAEEWLAVSASARLHWVLTRRHGYRADNASPAWTELRQLAVHRVVVLSPELSVALWLPDAIVGRPAATVVTDRNGQGTPLPETPSWDVETGPIATEGLVTVSVSDRWQVYAHAPDAPVLHTDPAVSSSLRAVGDLLDSRMRKDVQGRRRAAHKDSRVLSEISWAATRRRFGTLPIPSALDRRDWRLGGAATFREWLLLHGYPMPSTDRLDPEDAWTGPHDEDTAA